MKDVSESPDTVIVLLMYDDAKMQTTERHHHQSLETHLSLPLGLSAFRCDLVVAIPHMGLEVHTCGKCLQRCFAAAACLAGCHIIDSSTAMLAAFGSACIRATAAACICRGTGYIIPSCPILAFRCLGTASGRGSDGLAPTLAGEEADSGSKIHVLLCHVVSGLEGAYGLQNSTHQGCWVG